MLEQRTKHGSSQADRTPRDTCSVIPPASPVTPSKVEESPLNDRPE